MAAKMNVDEMNLSLNGCGYLGIYHVGVCSCIKRYYPQVLKNKISGGSVGALVACAFMCDVPLEICTRRVFDVSMKVRNGILGPMSPDLNIMKLLHDHMDEMLPEDAHLHCDGKLFASVTRFDNGENVLLSSFNSRAELLQALMCSCFIPVYCGYEPPVFRGVAYVDAALSNNSPWLDKGTVTVAPFSGNSDICPENDGMFLRSFTLSNTSIGLTAKNMYMLFRVLFPGSPDIQKDFCQKGYNDALRFLRDNGLIECPNCIADAERQDHSKCKSPEHPMPAEISNEIEKAVAEFKKNLGYRLFQYRSMKFLYYMNIPSIVTAKVTYVVISAVLQKVQNKAGSCADDLWRHFLQILREGLYRQSSNKKLAKLGNSKNRDSQTCKTLETCLENAPKENRCEYKRDSCDSGNSSDSENSDLNADLKMDVPLRDSNKYPCSTFSLQPSFCKSFQMEFPLREGKGDIQGSERPNTYIC